MSAATDASNKYHVCPCLPPKHPTHCEPCHLLILGHPSPLHIILFFLETSCTETLGFLFFSSDIPGYGSCMPCARHVFSMCEFAEKSKRYENTLTPHSMPLQQELPPLHTALTGEKSRREPGEKFNIFHFKLLTSYQALLITTTTIFNNFTWCTSFTRTTSFSEFSFKLILWCFTRSTYSCMGSLVLQGSQVSQSEGTNIPRRPFSY